MEAFIKMINTIDLNTNQERTDVFRLLLKAIRFVPGFRALFILFND